jgi:photosystem II stability/assembly factor-like uncharacterized protein
MKTRTSSQSAFINLHLFTWFRSGLVLLLALGAFSKTCPAQKPWLWQNPSPTGNNLRGVDFVDEKTGWAVGWFGEVIKTTDGGATWSFQRLGTSVGGQQEPTFYALDFIDKETGWIVGGSQGAGDVILKTLDGGKTWSSQRTGPASIAAVKFVDSNIGWAVDYGHGNSTILKTIDGGAHWATQFGAGRSLNSIYFIDEKTGWAVGGGGLILKTTDGGDSWETQASRTTNNLNSVHFLDKETGWVVGNDNSLPAAKSTILKTTDGGENWIAQRSGTTSPLRAVTFTDKENGWVVGGTQFTPLILRTRNGGDDWTAQTFGNGGFISLYSVSFFDKTTGWAVGSNGKMLATTDGGDNWVSQSPGTRGGIGEIQMVDNDIGFAVGGEGFDGIVLSTTNGGAMWTPQLLGLSLLSLSFVDDSRGWVSGAYGAIWNTMDGGASWRPQNSGTSNALASIQFRTAPSQLPDVPDVPALIGWAAGEGGTILKSTNGGATWIAQNSGVTDSFASIRFAANRNTGWVAGYCGQNCGHILNTTDGGANWKIQFTAVAPLSDVFFLDENIGWAVGGSGGGIILNTTDGGENWAYQLYGGVNTLTSVHFSGRYTGWAVGQLGTMLETTDGGAHWVLQTKIFGEDYASVYFTSPSSGWVTGSRGTILHTNFCFQCDKEK